MIRVILGPETRPGVWSWTCVSPPGGKAYSGFSRAPLLDACRALKRMGEDTGQEIGLFDEGSADYRIKTTIGKGAGLTVKERDRDSPRFARWESNPRWRDAAE